MSTHTAQQRETLPTVPADTSVLQADTGTVQPKVKRIINAYTKEGDHPIAEYPLVGIDVKSLQELFGVPRDNPMYDVYPVGETQARQLQPFVKTVLDLQAYDYFVECYAE